MIPLTDSPVVLDTMEAKQMTNEATMNKLIEIHFTAMADAFRIQLQDNALNHLSFEERLGLLVDTEYSSRKNNRLHKLIRLT